jgi:hypothetical protein
MRLAFITSAFPPQVTDLALTSALITSELAKRGHTVKVFIPDYYFSKVRSSPQVSPKLEIFPQASLPNPFDRGQFIIAAFPTELPVQIASFKPDIVYYANPQIHQFPFLGILLAVKHIPLVIAYEPPMSSISSFLIGTFSTLARKVIVNSDPSANYLSKFGIKEKTIIIPRPKNNSKTELKSFLDKYERAFSLL